MTFLEKSFGILLTVVISVLELVVKEGKLMLTIRGKHYYGERIVRAIRERLYVRHNIDMSGIVEAVGICVGMLLAEHRIADKHPSVIRRTKVLDCTRCWGFRHTFNAMALSFVA